jgi:hypothetical protein
MDLLFDITPGKTVIFVAIFPRENFRNLSYCKVIIFSFILNEGNFAEIFFLFYWQTDNDDTCTKYY